MVQDGVDPLEMLENVEITYHQYEHCHKMIKIPESINELKQWLRQVDSGRPWVAQEVSALPTHGMDLRPPRIDRLIKNMGLERGYRRAVVAQQRAVKNAVKWQAESLPVSNRSSLSASNLTLEGRSGASSATRRGRQVVLKRPLYLLQVRVRHK
jgi:hypothetical protein